jgi:ParB family chromosome partitioning protein
MEKMQLLELSLDRLIADESNVRRELGGIDELAQEVRRDGILQPILVREHPSQNGLFQIVAGHRRFAAAKQAGFETIPAVVRTIGDNEKTALQLVENIQREDLSAIEIANGLKALVEQCGDAQSAAERLGQTKNWVNKHLALLKLDPKVVKAIHRAGLGIAGAREVSALARAGNVQDAVEAAQALSDGKLRRNDLAARNRQIRSGATTEQSKEREADRIFERNGNGYSVLITVGMKVALDEHAERRIDAMLANFDQILGVAA